MSENQTTQESLVTEAVAELIALGAASAANAENAFQVYYNRLTNLGVSKEDMIQTINIALSVKARPHQAIIDMAQACLLNKKPGCGGDDCSCGPDGCEEEAGCGGGCGCN